MSSLKAKKKRSSGSASFDHPSESLRLSVSCFLPQNQRFHCDVTVGNVNETLTLGTFNYWSCLDRLYVIGQFLFNHPRWLERDWPITYRRSLGSPPSANCQFSFQFPMVFWGFWVSRNLEAWKSSLKGWFWVADLDRFLWFLLVSVGFRWFLRFLEYTDMWGFREMGPRSPSFLVSWFLSGFYRVFGIRNQ